jgi:hypothetical protein
VNRAALAKLFQVERLVRVACMFGLLAMALMAWSVLDPTPFPVMVAMSVGQVIGTLSLVCYIAAVFLHNRNQRATNSRASGAPER